MTFSEEDWAHESDYARYVLRGPSPEDLRHKADLDRKAAKENGMRYEPTPREREDEDLRLRHEGLGPQAHDDHAEEQQQAERHLQTEQGQPEGWLNE